MAVTYLDFSKAFDSFSQHSPGATYGCLWLVQVHSLLRKKLTGCPGSENGGE